jgi:hypothetical protein
MAPTIFIKPHDPRFSEKHEWSARVLSEFTRPFPSETLLCFLDAEDWSPFKAGSDSANRGLYRPTQGSGYADWPPYVMKMLFGAPQRQFDHVIYLHNSTCSDKVGLSVTLAHELQHYCQYCCSRDLSQAGVLLLQFIGDVPVETTDALHLTKWSDVPHEREARIVSKKIAVSIFGPDLVHAFIAKSIASAADDADKVDLEFLQSIEPSDYFYDLRSETKLVYSRLAPYRSTLDRLIQEDRSRRLENFKLDHLLSQV